MKWGNNLAREGETTELFSIFAEAFRQYSPSDSVRQEGRDGDHWQREKVSPRLEWCDQNRVEIFKELLVRNFHANSSSKEENWRWDCRRHKVGRYGLVDYIRAGRDKGQSRWETYVKADERADFIMLLGSAHGVEGAGRRASGTWHIPVAASAGRKVGKHGDSYFDEWSRKSTTKRMQKSSISSKSRERSNRESKDTSPFSSEW